MLLTRIQVKPEGMRITKLYTKHDHTETFLNIYFKENIYIIPYQVWLKFYITDNKLWYNHKSSVT